MTATRISKVDSNIEQNVSTVKNDNKPTFIANTQGKVSLGAGKNVKNIKNTKKNIKISSEKIPGNLSKCKRVVRKPTTNSRMVCT